MAESSELKIPKTAVRVELAALGEPVRRYSVYVADRREGSPERQRVIDLLEGGGTFVPVVDDGGCHLIVNKDTFLWVSVPLVDGALPVEEEGGDAVLYDVRRPVSIELHGGSKVEGDLLYTAPAERARVVDQLNGSGRFVRLWQSESVLLVNKHHIVAVRDESPSDPS